MDRRIIILIVLGVFLFAASAEAANQLVVVPAPGRSGVFYLKGVDFTDVGGVEVELEYDTAALANPRITQGSLLASTMFVPNPRFSSKSVKIAAMSLSPIKGSGDLAIITFDLKGAAPGTVTVARRTFSTSKGIAVPTPLQTPSVADSSGSDRSSVEVKPGNVSTRNTSPAASTSGGAGSVIGGISVGTITLPQDQLATAERKPDYQPLVTDLRKDMTLPAGSSTSSAAATGKQPAEEKLGEQKFISYKSVKQLFNEFKGEKNSKALIALFAETKIPDFTQVPPVAISDGVTPVKLTLVLKPAGNESPKFIVQGANVKQLRGEGEDVKWIIEVLPKKGIAEVKLTVIDGRKMMEYPLTVAPPADVALAKAAKISEADFTLYLAKPQKYDLNNDKKFDETDDFIYTANYIVAMKITPEKLKASDSDKDKKAVLKTESKVESAEKSSPSIKDGKELTPDKQRQKTSEGNSLTPESKSKTGKKTPAAKAGKNVKSDKQDKKSQSKSE